MHIALKVLAGGLCLAACADADRSSRRDDAGPMDAGTDDDRSTRLDGSLDESTDTSSPIDAGAGEDGETSDGESQSGDDAGSVCSGDDASITAPSDASCEAGTCTAGQRCSKPSDCENTACAVVACDPDLGKCEPRHCLSVGPVQSQLQDLRVAALARDPLLGTLYASLGSYQSNPGAVVAFEPGSLTPTLTVALPGAGGALAVTDDGSALYVAVNGTTPGVARIDLATRTAAAPFSLGTHFSEAVSAQSLAAVPGHPDHIGVVGSGGQVGLHVYRAGVTLFDASNTNWQTNEADRSLSVSRAVFASAERAYTFDSGSTSAQFATVDLNAFVPQVVGVYDRIVPQFADRLRMAGGKLFAETAVIAPEFPRVLGTLHGSGPVAVTGDAKYAYLTVVPGIADTFPHCRDLLRRRHVRDDRRRCARCRAPHRGRRREQDDARLRVVGGRWRRDDPRIHRGRTSSRACSARAARRTRMRSAPREGCELRGTQ